MKLKIKNIAGIIKKVYLPLFLAISYSIPNPDKIFSEKKQEGTVTSKKQAKIKILILIV